MWDVINSWKEWNKARFVARPNDQAGSSLVTARHEDKEFSMLGNIFDVTEDFYVVKSEDEEFHVLRSVTSIQFITNDEVRISGIQREIGFSEATENAVNAISPARSVVETGRVSHVNHGYFVFDQRVLLIDDELKIPRLKFDQACEYEAIATNQRLDDKAYAWRIIDVKEVKEAEKLERLVEMKCPTFSHHRSDRKIVEKFISIEKRTNRIIFLKSVKCMSTSQMIEVKNGQKEIKLQRGGIYKVFFSVFPRQAGSFCFSFIADFESFPDKESFQKKCSIEINIFNEQSVIMGERSRQTPRFNEIRFKNHSIPYELRIINVKNLTAGIEKLRCSHPVCFDELSQENYLKKLHTEIFIEELALEIAFENYHIEKDRFIVEGDSLKLKVADVAEKRPSISVGDIIKVRKVINGAASSEQELQVINIGRITKVGEDFVLVKFPSNVQNTLLDYEYSIDFEFSRTIFRQQHHAIDTVTSSQGLGFNFIFPDQNKIENRRFPQIDVELNEGKLTRFGNELQWFDKKLNKYQKEAVVNVLRGENRPLPYLIYGPPGTGKTMTIVELITQLFHLDDSVRIIVATPSNSAAYNLTETLTQQTGIGRKDLIRIVSNNQLEKGLIPDYLQDFCVTVSSEDVGYQNPSNTINHEEKGLRKNFKKQDIEKYRICIGTLSSFGSLMKMKFRKNHFTHVIIDEAGQAVEPQTLIPVTLLSKEKCQLVLAGDPKQLGASSVSHFGRELKFDVSMIERLLTNNLCYAQSHGPQQNEYDARFVTQLKINYRSLPSVLNLCNELFYNSELQSAIEAEGNEDAKLLQTIQLKTTKNPNNCGVHFYNVAKGMNRREKDSSSWFNPVEVNAVFSYLALLKRTADIPFKDVGVITPYALQKQKLKKKIDILPDTDLKIGTVEEFQGQERPIILLSMVRTEDKYFNSDIKFGLGFVCCPKRMNVAISRARSLLVVFGNAELMKKDKMWEKLIEYTQQNGTFFDDNRS